jgi:hypothetical protein
VASTGPASAESVGEPGDGGVASAKTGKRRPEAEIIGGISLSDGGPDISIDLVSDYRREYYHARQSNSQPTV